MTASASSLDSPSSRVLSFKGGCNFRDIGGYSTSDRGAVRWGRVYRTGVLTYFTADDHAPLAQLGVRAICDLRREEERGWEPTRWPDASVRLLGFNNGTNVPTIRGFAANRSPSATGMFDAMIDLYRALPAWMAGRVHGMFDGIATEHVPMIVHCAAGKDRTGIAIALLLLSVGVPYETVLEDYLLTNDAGDFEAFILAQHAAANALQMGVTDAHHPLLAMPEDVRRVLFSADTAFLAAAFEQIERDFGGADAYLRHCGVTDAMRERVRTALVE